MKRLLACLCIVETNREPGTTHYCGNCLKSSVVGGFVFVPSTSPVQSIQKQLRLDDNTYMTYKTTKFCDECNDYTTQHVSHTETAVTIECVECFTAYSQSIIEFDDTTEIPF